MHIVKAAPTQRRKLNCKNQWVSLCFYLLRSLFLPLLSPNIYFLIRTREKHPRSQQNLACHPPQCVLCCSRKLGSLHLKGVNRLMLPCQQTPPNPLKPFQWPWILFKCCSPRLAKIIQLSKIQMTFLLLLIFLNLHNQKQGLVFPLNKNAEVFSKETFWEKKNENVASFAAKTN